MWTLIKPNLAYDFVGKRWIWMGISLLALCISLVSLSWRGLNWGIDFSGGVEAAITLPATVSTQDLRKALSVGSFEDVRIQENLTAGARKEFILRLSQQDRLETVQEDLKKVLIQGWADASVERMDVVGPSAGKFLRNKGLLSMIYALLLILVWVALRFDARFAPGAVLALFHDALLVLGLFSITGKPFDLTILAAILALIGYSNNDTMILFDRIRETMETKPKEEIPFIVNRAVNDTLGRTLVTSLTTLLVLIALYFFGGPVLEGFSLALLFGVVVGTYSSIFIASSFVVLFTQWGWLGGSEA